MSGVMGNIKDTYLENELQSSYLDYAMSVIIGRAIPDVRDGLKPVQRRILYAMYKINNTHEQPTKKSARVVGEVIGKFHPHGDLSIYNALVRMAQDFSSNHMFVEGQGNFGSIDGDPPAAMRYTEVRLTKIAEEMLEDIEKQTVEMIPNFDNTEKEPEVLPAKIPNLLVNGASGIAVGVATSIPPHNLAEVCDSIIYLIDHKEATFDDISKIIKGPDFPTSGIAIVSEDTYNGYRYGRGHVTLRAQANYINAEHKIEITSVPYGTNKARTVREIINLVKDKRIIGITDVRDESDKSGIKISIELRKDIDGEQIIKSLYKYTQLEITIPIISLAIQDKKLKSFNLMQLLNIFIDYRRLIIKKRSQFDLDVATEKKHITDGLIIASTQIENVVKDIKESSDTQEAKARLTSKYALSEKQAAAILEMKLGKLTSLEYKSLVAESNALQQQIDYLKSILSDPAKIDSIIKEETKEIKDKYGKKRRTEIIYSSESTEIKDEDAIIDEKIAITLTNSGYIKRMSMNEFKEQGRGGKGVIAINLKEGDYVKQTLQCMTKDYILCFSNKGMVYWLKAYNIPEAGRYAEGRSIVNLLNLDSDEKIIAMISIRDFTNSKILFLTKHGIVKKVAATRFSNPRSSGIKAIKLNEGDELASVISYSKAKYIFISTKNGKAIKFNEASLRESGRGAAGIRGIKLKDDMAEDIIVANDNDYIFAMTEKGFGKLTKIEAYRLQRRGGSGTINIKRSEKTGNVAKSISVVPESKVIVFSSNGSSIMFPASSVRISGRASKGVRVMKLDSGSVVVDAQRVE